MSEIILVQPVCYAIKFAADLGQKSMQPLLADAFHRTILDPALQPADLERKITEIIDIAFVLQPVKIPLDVIYRINYRAREIII